MKIKIDGRVVEQGLDTVAPLVTGLIGDNFEMFNNSDMSSFELIAMIRLQKQLERKKTFESNIDIEVQRLAPSYNPTKAKILSQLITEVSITTDTLNYDESPHGSTSVNHFEGIDIGEVNITWWDLKRNDVIDFLTMVSPRNQFGLDDLPNAGDTFRAANTIAELINNHSELSVPILAKSNIETKPILPTDGTYLLPKEYYFSIKLQNTELDRVTGVRSHSVIIDGEYRLVGNLEIARNVDSEEWAKVTANFKPL